MRDTNIVEVVEIDDAIPRLYQDQIESEVASNRMAWFFNQESGRRGARVATSYGGFSHTAFHVDDNAAPSPMTALLLPALFMFCERAGVPFSSLLRIRLGLFTRGPADIPHHNPHVDFYQPHYTALYYVNDSDGDTVVFNETFDQVSAEMSVGYTNEGRFTVARRISPRKGRMIGFPGKHYHASMHPTKSASRMAIAFSFL